jgi:hypothetical protein
MLPKPQAPHCVIALGFSASAAQAQEACAGGFSRQFHLKDAVEDPARFRLADLQGRASSRVTISFVAGTTFNTKSYIGVPLLDLLNEAVIIVDPARKNDVLRKYVVIRGSDYYESIIAVADLLPSFGHQDVLIAFREWR